MPVAEKLEEAAVKPVSAAFQNHVDLGAAAVPELGRVVAGLNLELLNGVDRRQSHILVDVGIVVVHAVKQEVVRLLAGAVDAERSAFGGVFRALRRQLTARRQQRKRQEVALVERQFLHHAIVDHLAHGRGVGLHDRRDLGDGHFLGGCANL